MLPEGTATFKLEPYALCGATSLMGGEGPWSRANFGVDLETRPGKLRLHLSAPESQLMWLPEAFALSNHTPSLSSGQGGNSTRSGLPRPGSLAVKS